MRLLHTESLNFKEFFGDEIPPYAILSHTWTIGEEIEFRDVKHKDGPNWPKIKKKKGFYKFHRSAKLALRQGYEYIWVDTCCIDKSSSSETQESINSMYKWYERSSICYVYLEDLEYQPGASDTDPLWIDFETKFKGAKWFRRGWTLQELIAPRKRIFFDKRWANLNEIIGYDRLLSLVQARTRIDHAILSKTKSLRSVNIATKMRWAAKRQTGREEDIAYSLLGIFNVHLSTHYGEGRIKAFVRLQKKILKISCDQTIFAWSRPDSSDGRWPGMLAASPDWFDIPGVNYNVMKAFPESSNMSRWCMTNAGLSISLQARVESPKAGTLRAFLPTLNRFTAEAPSFLLFHRGGNRYTRDRHLQYQKSPRGLETHEILVPQEDSTDGAVPTIWFRGPDLGKHLRMDGCDEQLCWAQGNSFCIMPQEQRGGYLAAARLWIIPSTGLPNDKTSNTSNMQSRLPTRPTFMCSIKAFLHWNEELDRWVFSCALDQGDTLDDIPKAQGAASSQIMICTLPFGNGQVAISWNSAHEWYEDDINIDVFYAKMMPKPPEQHGDDGHPRLSRPMMADDSNVWDDDLNDEPYCIEPPRAPTRAVHARHSTSNLPISNRSLYVEPPQLPPALTASYPPPGPNHLTRSHGQQSLQPTPIVVLPSGPSGPPIFMAQARPRAQGVPQPNSQDIPPLPYRQHSS